MLTTTGVNALDRRRVWYRADCRFYHFAAIVIFCDELVSFELVISGNAIARPLLRTGLHAIITQNKAMTLWLVSTFAVA